MSNADVVDADAPVKRRPRGVTAVVALSVLQGALFLLVGTLLVAVHRTAEINTDFDPEPDLSPESVLATGVVFLVLGVVVFALAVGLVRGRDVARSVIAMFNVGNIAVQTYAVVARHDFSILTFFSLGLPIGVLWLLYGIPASQEYFER